MVCPQTRSLIRVEGLLTSLIFDHALRLRINSGESGSKASNGSSTNGGTQTRQNAGPKSSSADRINNIVGKIMNMATADLDNITGGRNFLSLCTVSFNMDNLCCSCHIRSCCRTSSDYSGNVVPFQYLRMEVSTPYPHASIRDTTG